MKKIFTLASLLLAFTLQSNADVAGGKLKLVGNQLSTADGQPIQLRGWSTHGKNWQGSCFDDKGDFELMKNKGANMARIAMYVEGDGGSEDGNWMKQCIDWTNDLGMYCIVDWHMLQDGNPLSKKEQAKNFFSSISQYVSSKGFKNVVYEICNEPSSKRPEENVANTSGDPHEFDDVWDNIKEYAEYVCPAIYANDPDAVVLVGTPQWDKALSFPMENPIDNSEFKSLNLMYTFHHYTCDQQTFLGILSAAAGSIPVFVSEWGASTDDGGEKSRNNCFDGADKLMKVCNGKNLGNQLISWANWSWSQDSRVSSSFSSYPNSMTQAGEYIVKQLSNSNSYSPTEHSAYEEIVFEGTEDFCLQLEKYDKGGNMNAYYDCDLDNEAGTIMSWGVGNAGVADQGMTYRADEELDLGYTDKSDKENGFKNIGWIINGEWVQYTIEVKHAGEYDFELYTCNHPDHNILGITVDGQNAIVDENGSEFVRAIKMEPCNGGVDGDYGTWGWVKPSSDYYPNKTYRIRFKEAGTHTLGLSFLTAAGGFGSLKLKGKDFTGVEDFPQAVVKVWPNPSEDGSVNVLVDNDSKVSIFNAQGVELISAEVAANVSTNLNASLAAGIYYVTVKNAKGISTEKLIVK